MGKGARFDKGFGVAISALPPIPAARAAALEVLWGPANDPKQTIAICQVVGRFESTDLSNASR